MEETKTHEDAKKGKKCLLGKMNLCKCDADCKMPKNVKIAIIAAVVIIVGAVLWYYKGAFVVATVNGAPISRLSVLLESEKQVGKTVIDSLVSKALVDKELNAKNIKVDDEEVDAELKKIEEQVTAQGMKLDEALASQNMTMEKLKNDIREQKKLEKLLADKIAVTDEEAIAYAKANNVAIPAEGKDAFVANVKNYLKQQKLSKEVTAFVAELKDKAKINYFVTY